MGGTAGGSAAVNDGSLSEVAASAAQRLLGELQSRHKKMRPTGPLSTDKKIADELSRVAGILEERSKQFLVKPNFYPDPSTIWRFRNAKGTTNYSVILSIFLYLELEYGNYLLDFILKEESIRKDSLVSAMREALGYGERIGRSDLSNLSGIYKLFRPSFWDPDNDIIMSRLEIGFCEEDRFSCRLTSAFPTVEDLDVFVGRIVPHGGKAMAILASGSPPENVILHFDQRGVGGGTLLSMKGIALTSIGGSPASAWPIYAVKTSTDFEPSVVSPQDIPQLVSKIEMQPVQKALRRGTISWDI